MRAAERVATYGAGADSLDLWLTVLGDAQAALTVSLLGRGLRTMSIAALAKLPHLGASRAARAFAAVELGRRLLSQPLARGQTIAGPKSLVDAYAPGLLDLEREVICVVCLDQRGRVVCDERIAMGGLTQCSVAPSEILRTAIRVAAPRIILLHTHPSSGDPSPSAEDDALTRRIAELCAARGLELVDHVIIAEHGHYSYEEHRRISR